MENKEINEKDIIVEINPEYTMAKKQKNGLFHGVPFSSCFILSFLRSGRIKMERKLERRIT